MKRNRKDKWAVYGECGGTFTNLHDAKVCAREASKEAGTAEIWNIDDGCWYIEYVDGKLTEDNWSRKRG